MLSNAAVEKVSKALTTNTSGFVKSTGAADAFLLGVGLDPDNNQIQLLGGQSSNVPDWSRAGNFGGSLVAVFNSFPLNPNSPAANFATINNLLSLSRPAIDAFWSSSSFIQNDPNIWWLIPHALNLKNGQSSGYSAAELSSKAEFICENFIEGSAPRSTNKWYNLESAAYVHLLNLLDAFDSQPAAVMTPTSPAPRGHNLNH